MITAIAFSDEQLAMITSAAATLPTRNTASTSPPRRSRCFKKAIHNSRMHF